MRPDDDLVVNAILMQYGRRMRGGSEYRDADASHNCRWGRRTGPDLARISPETSRGDCVGRLSALCERALTYKRAPRGYLKKKRRPSKQDFKMGQRLQYRRRLSYNTPSNRRRIVKTPGGRLVYQYVSKPAKAPACGNCKVRLPGIVKCRPHKLHSLSKRQKHVTRAYGGNLCHKCVRERVIRAFLIEEQKIVVKVLKAQKAAVKGK